MLRPAIHLETFGCQMNELDSELVMGQLSALGYRFVDTPDDAAVVLYNTCSVRDLAEQKVRSRLGEMAIRKRREPALVVGVLGCMAEREGEALLHRVPQVDILCGPGELDKLPALLDNAVRTRVSLVADLVPDESDEGHRARAELAASRSARAVALQGAASRRSSTLAAAGDTLELLDLSRSISPVDHHGSAYVRITRGCNKFCTYCVVPNTRGAEIHRPPDHIIDECRRLADAGVIEVTLLGQTVNHYRFEHGSAVTVGGVVQPQKGRSYLGGHRRDPFAGERVTTFADLLRRIHEEVPAIRRLRFVTSFPRDFGDDVLEVIRDSPRICRYLHVPAQSGSNSQLERMNRGYTVEQYVEFIDRARAFLHQPEIGRPLMLAGDYIVGFSGETEEDFEATKNLIRRVRCKNNFIFKYSPRPGSPAYDRLPDDVPDEIKRRRNNELLAIQRGISDEIAREHVGGVFDVFIEGISAQERKRIAAASSCDSAGGVALTVAGRSLTQANTSPASDPARDAPLQLSGRTEGDCIVFFDCPQGAAPDDLIGTIRPVRVGRGDGLSLYGSLEGAASPAAAVGSASCRTR
ncbi:MAG: radical SAM protein [Phycisphaeraceae bacterium]|nr:radical SAM protein [Phycisphaeraceae bacterium]MCB9847393.1 radical SAM protein [Phycisphaeraceae bacterium]